MPERKSIKADTIIFRGWIEKPKRYSFDSSEFKHGHMQIWKTTEWSQKELVTIDWTYHVESSTWYQPHFEIRQDQVELIMITARFLQRLEKHLPKDEWGNTCDYTPLGYLQAMESIKAVEVAYDDRTSHFEPLNALMPATVIAYRDDWQRVYGATGCSAWVYALDEDQARLKMVSALAEKAANSNSAKDYFENWTRAGGPICVVSGTKPDGTKFRDCVLAVTNKDVKALQTA